MTEDVPPYGGTTTGTEQRAAELRALAVLLGWSQRETARQLGWPERDVRYWMSGRMAAPPMVLYAMRYLEQHREVAARVADGGRQS